MPESAYLPLLITHGTDWVKQLRELHRLQSQTLSEGTRGILAPFFESRILDSARFRLINEIPNPQFYSLLPPGTPIPIDFRLMAGLTVGDTVLLAQSRINTNESIVSLLFHELVHVVQYDLLGVDEFITQYVNGWAACGMQYDKIPMEQEAYSLQAKFADGASGEFSVATIISDRLRVSMA